MVSSAQLLFGGLVALAFLYLIVSAPEDERGDRMVALGWGAVFAFTTWYVWRTWGVGGAIDGVRWLFTDGLVWVALVLVLFFAYVWQSAARTTNSLEGALRQMQTEATRPFARAIGAISAVLIVLATVLFEASSQSVDVLGFLWYLVEAVPVVAAYLVTVVLGGLSHGWELPLIGAFLPEWLADMPPSWWFGITVTLLGIAVAIRESSHVDGVRR